MFFYPPPISTEPISPQRKAFTLLLVITMLALFAAVGVGFVIYAQSAATSSRYAHQAQKPPRAEVDPELMLAYFLGQLFYGPQENIAGWQSSMRGNDLATNMYGPYHPGRPLTLPYSGTGWLHYENEKLGGDDYLYVNRRHFPADGFVLDPGRRQLRNSPDDPLGPPDIAINPGHTYADRHNPFLAIMTADGEIVRQSFHIPSIFGSLDPSNANWTNMEGKYKIMRPRPIDNTPELGLPEDLGGDVCNIPNAKGIPVPGQPGVYYNNDSIWVDLNAPIMTGPDGRKFKPLFAAVVVPMDGKVNLNVHGNVHRVHGVPASHQGWGPWEVNYLRVAKDLEEFKKILRSPGPVYGRYGEDQQPSAAGGGVPTGQTPHPHSQVDFDGWGPLGPPHSGYRLPGEIDHLPYMIWPKFPAERYDNNTTEEAQQNHPSIFNPLAPQGDDRIFPWSSMEPLLRYGDSGSPFFSTDLFRLCPVNFADPRVRWLVTPYSFDFRRPSASPWLPAYNAEDYIQPPRLPEQLYPDYPKGQIAPPQVPPVLPTGEYTLGGHGLATALSRVDINRPLANYPLPKASDDDPAKKRIQILNEEDLKLFHKAQQDRQLLAKDIFDRLALVATGLRPGQPLPAKDTPAFAALRSLAQLAVNIVDYRDEDDYVTPFKWYVNPEEPADFEYVYGTEMPNVVLNEIFAKVGSDPLGKGPPGDNGPPDQPGGAPVDVAFWVELLNPFQTNDARRPDGQPWLPEKGDARLQVKADQGETGYAVYKLVVLNTTNKNQTKTDLHDPANVKGDPHPDDISPNPNTNQGFTIVDNFTNPAKPADEDIDPWLIQTVDKASVQPNFQGKSGKNEGFYVLGPEDDFPGVPNPDDPNAIRATLRLKSMSYKLQAKDFNPANGAVHTVLLRRLACPHLPPQEDPTQPLYNPYITIDFLESIPSHDIRPNAPKANLVEMHSLGRRQPYGAFHDVSVQDSVNSQIVRQMPDPPNGNQPQHTFFRHNAIEAADPSADTEGQTLAIPFDWMPHLDRQLISPVELLHVSGYAPHHLTQRFMIPLNPKAPPDEENPILKLDHRARWFDERTRLYRAMELFEARARVPGSRLPGKININAVWDEETFQALCDAQGIRLTEAQVKVMFENMMLRRTPNFIERPDGTKLHVPGREDRPFLSVARGIRAPDTESPFFANAGPGDHQAFQGSGIADTFFRDIEGGNSEGKLRLFSVPPTTAFDNHPYRKAELMTKIFNNVTTRSNVFAVWLTVGFFEVKEETPVVKLGGEIGRRENRHVRYRMFAIVDRTQLGALQADLTTLTGNVTPTTELERPGLKSVTLAAASGTNPAPADPRLRMPRSGFTWELYPGMSLVIGRGTANEETVIVQSVDGNTITAYFQKPHTVGERVSLPGEPVLVFNPATSQLEPVDGVVYGHPGPQTRFDMRQYPAVVPHWSIIERTGG